MSRYHEDVSDRERELWRLLAVEQAHQEQHFNVNAHASPQIGESGLSGAQPVTLPTASISGAESAILSRQNADMRTPTEKRADELLFGFLQSRRQKGREAYGKGLDYDDPKHTGRWERMALEELADAVQYLTAAVMEKDAEIERMRAS